MYSHRNYEVNVKHHCNTFIKISPNVHFCTSDVSEKYIREKSGIYFVSWHLTFSMLKYTSYFCPLHKKAIHVFFLEQTSLIRLFVRRAGICLFFHIQLMVKASWRHSDPSMWLCVCSRQDRQTSLHSQRCRISRVCLMGSIVWYMWRCNRIDTLLPERYHMM